MCVLLLLSLFFCSNIVVVIAVIWASGLDATTDSNTDTVGAGVVDGTSDVATASTSNDNVTNNNNDPNWDTLDRRVALGVAKKQEKLNDKGFFLFSFELMLQFIFFITTQGFYTCMPEMKKNLDWGMFVSFNIKMNTGYSLCTLWNSF